MTSPYATPRYPGAPFPTPTSQGTSRKVPRAPIVNPFEQFPESEFQSWIGDITGAIKTALGRDDPGARTARPLERVEREEESVEDSFADIMARRAAKGKARAVEVGDEEQPIVIESDEEAEESEEVLRTIVAEDDDEELVPEERGEAPEAEEEVQIPVHDNANEGAEEEESSDQSGSEDEEEDAEDEEEAPAPVAHSPEVIDLLSDDEDEDEAPAQQTQHEENAEDEEGSEAGSEEAYAAAVAKLEQRLYAPYEDEEDELDEDEDDGEDEDEEAGAVAEQPAPAVPETLTTSYMGFAEEDAEQDASGVVGQDQPEREVDIADPWEGPNTFAEDYYSGGDFLAEARSAADPHVLPNEVEDDEIIEVAGPTSQTQPSEPAGMLCGASFIADAYSPEGISITTEEAQEVQLPDPWSGVRMYAEDYYSGGDLRESDLRTRLPSPSHLTPADEELTDFLTPDAGTPEGAAHRVTGTDDSSVEPRSDGHQYSLMEELYPDVAKKTPVRGRMGVDPTLELDEDAEEEQHLSGGSHSPSPPKFTSHVDWNWPPAFPAGRLASRAGHLQSPGTHEVLEISDDEAESPAMPIAALPLPRSEAMAEGATQVAEETPVTSNEAREEPFEKQLQDFTNENVDTSGGQYLVSGATVPYAHPYSLAPSQYNAQQSVDDLYADLDTFLPAGDQQGEMSTEEADAFIRDFLFGPSSVGFAMTEPTADAGASTSAETAVPSAEPQEAAGHEERSAAGEMVPADATPDVVDLSTAVEIVEYEVEEPLTEGRRTAVRARAQSFYPLSSHEACRSQTMHGLPVLAFLLRSYPTAKAAPFSWS